MKKKIIGWSAFGAVLLAAGVAVYLSGPKGTGGQEKISATRPVAGISTAVQARIPQEQAVVAQDAAIGIAPDGSTILAERQSMLANGEIEQRRMVRKSGKNPLRIVVETLQKDRDLGKFVPVGRTEMVADHVLVALREDCSQDELKQLAAQYNAEVVRALSDDRTFIVRLKAPGLDAVEQAIEQFRAEAASIVYAEPDYVRSFSLVPNDTMYGALWGMTKISMPQAWEIGTGSRSSVVAVIDSGMDMDHTDLVANLWVNNLEVAGDNIDNDGNGYIDDVNGWDFVTGGNDPEDGDGHGTHCAGTIGAVGNNANQVVGVCWSASIMPLRAGTGSGLLDSDIVDAIRYAARNGAKVLSNSYGGAGFSQTVYDAIDYANSRGCIFVAAAGNDAGNNDSLPIYPAGYDLPNVISVAATDQNDNLASFSNYGASSVDLAAPGVDIVSTYLNGATESLQGTSMACPHVAGALALLVSVKDDVTPAEARQLLLDSVDEVSALSGKVLSGGRLNVYSMFSTASDADKDGMPDLWEEDHGLDPNDPLDALLDDDNDFLINLQEYKNACDPHDADSDDDSLIDGWEVRYGFDPRDVLGTLPKLQYLGANSQCLDTYDLALTNGHAYVADGQYGLKVLNLTSPAVPVLSGVYATAGSARGVAIRGNYAYVADAVNGLFILNVSNPADPTLVSSLPVPASKVAVGGGFAYLASVSNGLCVINVSDPANAYQSASFTGNGDPNFRVNDVALVGSTVYMALDGGLGQISTSVNPSSYSIKTIADDEGNRNCTALFDNGSELYVSLQNYGVLAYNHAKVKLGGLDTPGSAEDVACSDGLIYVADGAKGLRVLNAINLSSITPHASYANVAAYGVAVADGYAYVAGRGNGLQIFRSAIDSDGDGMYDTWEMTHFGNLDQSYTNDFDADGIMNWGEYLAGLNPANPDQDSDGLIDGNQEVQIYLTDPRTTDTDDDGLSDSYEVSTNGVDNLYLTDPLTADSDGDGMPDKWELDHGFNPLANDAAGDADSDGATNLAEQQAGTDPNTADSDADGIPDGWEIDMALNPLVNDASNDDDRDGLTNLQEYGYNTNPFQADSDGDGLTDPAEISTHGTDPNQADSDSDGMPDGWEVGKNLNPLVNDAAVDSDSDTLSNYEEYLNGSDPDSDDTDVDGFGDEWEYAWRTMATNAADPVVVDDDSLYDIGQYGGLPQDPQLSDPDEDGSINHPFDAIQEAIDVAADGYTILVKPGQYYGFGNRNIDLSGLQLRILAENQADPSVTVVKSHGLGPVFVFNGGQDTSTVLAGFSIQSSMVGIDCSNGDCGEENGIVCSDSSSPLITNCVVEICRNDAIYCEFASSPTLVNVTIRTIYEGNGIHAINGSTPIIVDCSIGDIRYGCGVYAVDSSGLAITNTAIYDCQNSLGVGRGVWLVNDSSATLYNTTVTGCQGGIRCDNSSPTIDRCTIADNEAPDYYTVNGVGFMALANIAVWAEDADNNATDEQHVEENGGGILLMDDSLPTIQNCVIASNRTWASDHAYSVGDAAKPYYGLGGGIFAGAGCATRLINCTIADNVAMTFGGGITTYGNYVEYLRNDIIWSNRCLAAWLDTDVDPPVLRTPGNSYFNSLHCNQGTSHFDPWYCDISDGYGFVVDRYNFAANPLFAGGGDYHLQDGSPCIDKGTYYNAPLYDCDGVQRPLDGDADTNTSYSVDIGAYEYVNPLADTDGDGATNLEEFLAGTDLNNPDTDGDGIPDGWEIDMGLDPLFDDAAEDPDGDGLTNLQEYENNTNPLKADSDDDGLSDAEEINIHGTDPNNPDTDGDGMPDGWEVAHGLDPLVNDAGLDNDDDGLTNEEEYLNGSDPDNPDTDGDGFDDRWEYEWGTQATNAADPVVVDDDHPLDPRAYDPMISNPDEDGSLWHPFDSIQKAIDVALDGMTVLVTNGYYIGHGNMNIDTKGKAITITAFSTNATDTIIDADGLGAAFIFQSGETTSTVVRGFAITSPPGDCNDGDCGYEHGIVCKDASSPSIVDCYIFDCALYGITAAMASNPRIENTVVENCGGGILSTEGATPVIVDSSILNCGSGIVARDSIGLNISGSLIANSNARGIAIENDPACSVSGSTIESNLGGMSFLNSTVLVDGCVIRDNIAPDYYTIGGTKFKSSVNIAVAAESNPDMTDVGDEDENGAGILLGHGSVLELRNSVLAGNVAVALDPDYPENKAVPDYGLGGGLYIGEECYATNMNCTYGDNEARRGGGISSHGTQPDVLRNTVLWDNDAVDMYVVETTNFTTNLVFTGMSGTESNFVVEVVAEPVPSITNIAVSAFDSLHCRSGAFDVWYCDVENGGSYVKPYKYVISQDPLFDSNYALGTASPCIDTGTITLAPIVDIAGISRPLDGNNDGVAKVDIGAYEYVHHLADTDGDGVLDVDEIAVGTDPTTVPSALLDFMAAYCLGSLNADDDGDGVSNLDEYNAGTNPTNSDTDGDQSPDGDEMIAGTIATDPTSYFYVSDIQPNAEGGCDVIFDTVPGRFYTVYCCSQIGGPWNVLVADEPGDGTPMVIVDPNPEGSCFYKVDVRN